MEDLKLNYLKVCKHYIEKMLRLKEKNLRQLAQ